MKEVTLSWLLKFCGSKEGPCSCFEASKKQGLTGSSDLSSEISDPVAWLVRSTTASCRASQVRAPDLSVTFISTVYLELYEFSLSLRLLVVHEGHLLANLKKKAMLIF